VVAKAAGPLAKRSANIGRAVGINVHAIGRALGGFRCLATVLAGLCHHAVALVLIGAA